MSSTEFYRQFKGVAGQTDMAEYVSLTDQRRMHITLPELNEQRAIAHILGTLDDKIELNRRTSETLEAMARALFKSWFVDFDPVRAKAEGRDPGLPKEIADLFPDSFEESELGEIPKGWRVGTVGDLTASIYSGGTPSTQNPNYWGGEISWLSSGETREKFIIDTERKITESGVADSSTRWAPALSTVIASAGQGNTRGQTSLLAIESYVNQSVVVLVADLWASSPFHLFFDLEHRYEEYRRISDAHSSRGSLTTRLLAGLPAILPPREVVGMFDAAVAQVVHRVLAALRESRTLATLRDALLPNLLAGEIQIQVEAAVTGRVLPFQKPVQTAKKGRASEEFMEAIVIAELVRLTASPQHPLGRKRRTKLAYFAHRKADEDVTKRFLKKTAGPYSPWVKYQGPETIAIRNGYVKSGQCGKLVGLLPGDRVAEIVQYVPRYPAAAAVAWAVKTFGRRTNDDLELLTTTDFAALELVGKGKEISLAEIKVILKANKEWAPKLDRALFSDANITRALAELRSLFSEGYSDEY